MTKDEKKLLKELDQELKKKMKPIQQELKNQEREFLKHAKEGKCQKCERIEPVYCIALECLPDNNQNPSTFYPQKYSMVTLCQRCHDELMFWLKIPCQDPIDKV